MKFKISKLVGLITLAALFSYSSAVVAGNSCISGGGNWSAPAAWTGCASGVPTAGDTATLNGAVLLDTATAVAFGVTVNAALTFASGGFLTVGSGGHGTGFLNNTDVTVTGGSGIDIDTHLDNVVAFSNVGTSFTLGAPATLTVSGYNGKGIVNSGTFTGGTGLISTNSFTNTNIFDVGTGGMNISFLNSVASSLFTNTSGTLTLGSDISIAGDIGAGGGTLSGAGKMILTGDRNHTITGNVIVNNLRIAPLTGARTINISGTVTETGITLLSGASATNSIAFAGSGSFAASFISLNCASAGSVTNFTCTPPSSSPTSAPISLISYEKAPVFSREITLK